MRPCPGRSLRCFRRKCRSCPHRRNRPPSGGCSAILPGDGPLPIGIRVPPQFRGGRTGRGVGRAFPAAAPLSVSVALPYGGGSVPRLRILSGRGVLLSCGRSLSFRDGVLSVCFRDGPYRLRGVCSGHGLRRLGTGVRIGYGRIPCSVGQYDCGLPYRCLFRDTGRSGEVKGRDQYPGQQCRRDGIPVRMPDALPLAGAAPAAASVSSIRWKSSRGGSSS